MKNKFYTFLLIIIGGVLPAAAQDTTRCNARFGAAPGGLQVYFRAVDSLPGVEHYWDFGDSVILNYGNNVGVTHNYTHYGQFKVVHWIRNTATGCFDSLSQWVVVAAPPDQNCSLSLDARRDSLHHSIWRVVATPYFYGGRVDTLAWKVNNSFAGMGDTLVQTWAPGSYNVCATLNTSLGCHAETCVTVVVAADSTTNTYIPSYPNPASSQAAINVTLRQPAMIYIRVYSSMGKPVSTTAVSGLQGVNYLQVPVGKLEAGIYYIQVQYGNESKMSKIQKL